MKNTVKLLSVIAFTAIIVFSMTAATCFGGRDRTSGTTDSESTQSEAPAVAESTSTESAGTGSTTAAQSGGGTTGFSDVKMAAVSGNSSFAIKNDGTLWAWGMDLNGELGLGGGSHMRAVSPVQVGTDTDWAFLTSSGLSTMALKTDGSLWAWGSNGHGNLGDGTSDFKDVPTPIMPGKTWRSVSVGSSHTLAIDTDGALWAWGNRGLYGNLLGDGSKENKNVPTKIGTDTDWELVSAGDSHNNALKTDGSRWSWGNGIYGEDLWSTNYDVPTKIGDETDWVSISTTGSYTNAIKQNGSLWTWGGGSHDVSRTYDGTGEAGTKLIPTQIGTNTNWAFLPGGGHGIAIREDGSLWGWGLNTNGEVGNGTTRTPQYTPVQIRPDKKWIFVSTGEHTLAIDTDGNLWAWGKNNYGQLGNGTQRSSNTPIQVGQ